MAIEPFFTGHDRGFDRDVLKRLAAAITDVLQDLRQRIEAMADLRHWATELLHHREYLQGGDKSITCRGIVRQDDVTGGLAAKIVAAAQHLLEHIAIADRRAHEFQSQAPEKPLQSQI